MTELVGSGKLFGIRNKDYLRLTIPRFLVPSLHSARTLVSRH